MAGKGRAHQVREPIVGFQGCKDWKRLGGVKKGGQGLGWAHVGSGHSSAGLNYCCSCLRGNLLPPEGLSLTASKGNPRLLQPGKQGLVPISLKSSSSVAPALCSPAHSRVFAPCLSAFPGSLVLVLTLPPPLPGAPPNHPHTCCLLSHH